MCSNLSDKTVLWTPQVLVLSFVPSFFAVEELRYTCVVALLGKGAYDDSFLNETVENIII